MEVAPRYKLFALFTDLFGDHPDFFKILPYLTKKTLHKKKSCHVIK